MDINLAGEEELADLPGIGPGLASKIVQHRDRYGPFKSSVELMLVDGLSESRYLRIRDTVGVGGRR